MRLLTVIALLASTAALSTARDHSTFLPTPPPHHDLLDVGGLIMRRLNAEKVLGAHPTSNAPPLHRLRPMVVTGAPSLTKDSPSETSSVMGLVAEKVLPFPNAVHTPAADSKVSISGRRIVRENDKSVVFDHQQMWFNVSFTGRAAVYITAEFMCLNGGQTPTIFRSFASDPAVPDSDKYPEEMVLDTKEFQTKDVKDGVGPYCGKPITFPIWSTPVESPVGKIATFALFKDTEPNFSFRKENWMVFYGFSLVGLGSQDERPASEKSSVPRLRAHRNLHQNKVRGEQHMDSSSQPKFVPTRFSDAHLESLAETIYSDHFDSQTTPVSNNQNSAAVTSYRKRLNALGLTTSDVATILEGSSSVRRAPPVRRRRIEWVGDSVTMGFGAMCQVYNASKNSYAVESGYHAWSNPTCAFFGAECHISGWSGMGLIRNTGNMALPAMNEVYQRAVATSDRSDWRWNFSSWVPDAVVMRLGTNDYGNKEPNTPEFVKNYTDAVVKFFVDAFNRYGPKVQIFVACGPSRTDYCDALGDAISIVRDPSFPVKAAATNTHFIDVRQIYYDAKDPKHDGKTNVCFGHPDVDASYEMSSRAIGAIATVMNWNGYTF